MDLTAFLVPLLQAAAAAAVLTIRRQVWVVDLVVAVGRLG
jgi:hypothetical protein